MRCKRNRRGEKSPATPRLAAVGREIVVTERDFHMQHSSKFWFGWGGWVLCLLGIFKTNTQYKNLLRKLYLIPLSLHSGSEHSTWRKLQWLLK